MYCPGDNLTFIRSKSIGSHIENLLYLWRVKRIVSKRALKVFWEQYPDSKPYLQTWYETARKADWGSPHDIRAFYGSVSILKNSRVVFNVKGNNYRLVVKINYQRQWIFIRFIGTHREYYSIDANTI